MDSGTLEGIRHEAMDVVIVGGSLTGLMYGIMMKRLGLNVRILEQHTSTHREGQAAGISTGAQMQQFLAKYDLIKEPCTVSADGLQVVDSEFRLKDTRKIPFRLTTWKFLYYRLRANFDGLSSEYVAAPPHNLDGDGKALFEPGKRVLSLNQIEGLCSVDYEDLISGQHGTMKGHLVIGADGAYSSVRKLMLQGFQPVYAGYLTWRATVPETDVSEDTRQAFENKTTLYTMDRSYMIIYFVPGDKGSMEPGERHINFVWYHNCPSQTSEFADIMTDIDGQRHRSTLPPGKVRAAAWTKQQEQCDQVLAAPVKDLIGKVKTPFVTAVADFQASQASFLDGKVLLVGEALALFRPHVAQSTNQSAAGCMLLEKVMKGDVELLAWQHEVMKFAHLNRLWSNAYGTKLLCGYLVWRYHDLRHRLALVAANWGYLL